jgi:hypothetical protein
MSGAVGFAFTLALSDSIEQAGDALEAGRPGAFHYGDVDLRRAVERELYVRLAGRQDLLESFDSGRAPLPVGTPLEGDVVRRLLGLHGPARRPRFDREVRAARRLRWRVAPRSRPGLSVSGSERSVAFMLDHPKFVSFLAPILLELSHPPPIVVSLIPGLDSALRGLRAQHIPAYDARRMPRPRLRVGPGLAERLHLCAYFERLRAILDRERPRAVIVVEGNSPFDEITNRACQLLRIPCLCLQQGWSPVIHTGFRHMSFSRMLVWGAGFRELLEPHNPGQRFDVTGSPVFDEPAAWPGETSANLQTLTRQRSCLAVFLQGDSQLVGAPEREALIGIGREAARLLPDSCVIVREHPAHPLDARTRSLLGATPNLVLAAPGAHSMRAVLDASRVAISVFSTTLLESAARGRPAVVFNPNALPMASPDLAAMGAGIEVRTTSAATEAVVGLMRSEERRHALANGMSAFAQRFFAGAQPGAARGVRVLIDNLGAPDQHEALAHPAGM